MAEAGAEGENDGDIASKNSIFFGKICFFVFEKAGTKSIDCILETVTEQ